MRNKIVLENKPVCLCENAWFQMSTHNVILKYGGIATKLVVSHLLLILGNTTGYQVKALTLDFYPLIK